MQGIDFSVRFALMICESKQLEIIHREILFIFPIIKRGGHCQCDGRGKQTIPSLFMAERPLSQDHYSESRRASNYQVISIRFYSKIPLSCCYQWSCINLSIRYANFDHYWMSGPVFSSQTPFSRFVWDFGRCPFVGCTVTKKKEMKE